MENFSSFEDFKKFIFNRKIPYINNVEQFCNWYPDGSRQKDRLDKGYGKLLSRNFL